MTSETKRRLIKKWEARLNREPTYEELVRENRALRQRLEVLQTHCSKLQTNRDIAWTKYYKLRESRV
jgi:hypothetical protein